MVHAFYARHTVHTIDATERRLGPTAGRPRCDWRDRFVTVTLAHQGGRLFMRKTPSILGATCDTRSDVLPNMIVSFDLTPLSAKKLNQKQT